MKSLLLRSLLAAVLMGPAIGFASGLVALQGATKYEPPLSEAEFHQMGNLTVNEMEATLAKRRIKMNRWEWLRDSMHYSYFWKHVAHNAVLPCSGVFLACTWVGWMEIRHVQRLKTAA